MGKSILETIKIRKSIRTYEQTPVTDHDYLLIQEYITKEENLIGPLGRKARFEIIDVANNVSDKGVKLGTYGFIKNHQGYIVGIIENSKMGLVEFGYTFEKVILFATQLGVGTCWIGGTFNRNSFKQEINLRNGEFIPCISPIGYAKGRQRLFEKTLRYVTKADHKKTWVELFFDGSFEKALEEDKAEQFAVPIEMVRLGPSASNKQPWRLVLSSGKKQCHFYLAHTPNYSGNKLGFDMQLIDMGIAMCHFELACNEKNIEGKWVVNDPQLQVPDEHTEYMISWETI